MSTAIQMRIDFLRQHGVPFETKNNTQHVIVDTMAGKIDYWPSSNKWVVRGNGNTGVGVVDLVGYINRVNNPAPVMAVPTDEISELKDLLSHAWIIICNEGEAWPDNFCERVEKALNQKPEAHNSTSSLPWEE